VPNTAKWQRTVRAVERRRSYQSLRAGSDDRQSWLLPNVTNCCVPSAAESRFEFKPILRETTKSEIGSWATPSASYDEGINGHGDEVPDLMQFHGINMTYSRLRYKRFYLFSRLRC
jgi:hypothetical protein